MLFPVKRRRVIVFGDESTYELPNGWEATIELRADEDYGPPWEEEDGHGPITKWERYNNRGDGYKRPGAAHPLY